MDTQTRAVITDLTKRVRYLEKALAGFQEWTGICTSAANTIVAVYGAEYDGGTSVFTMTFASEEGQTFQIQQSIDGGVTWTVADNVVAAANSPAIQTVWESDPFDMDDLPFIFRVRRYPRALVPCAPPTAPACPDIITS